MPSSPDSSAPQDETVEHSDALKKFNALSETQKNIDSIKKPIVSKLNELLRSENVKATETQTIGRFVFRGDVHDNVQLAESISLDELKSAVKHILFIRSKAHAEVFKILGDSLNPASPVAPTNAPENLKNPEELVQSFNAIKEAARVQKIVDDINQMFVTKDIERFKGEDVPKALQHQMVGKKTAEISYSATRPEVNEAIEYLLKHTSSFQGDVTTILLGALQQPEVREQKEEKTADASVPKTKEAQKTNKIEAKKEYPTVPMMPGAAPFVISNKLRAAASAYVPKQRTWMAFFNEKADVFNNFVEGNGKRGLGWLNLFSSNFLLWRLFKSNHSK